MKIRTKATLVLALAALLAIAFAPEVAAQSSGQNCAISGACFTSYSTFQSWLPVVTIAILVSVTIVSAYYMFGVALNNNRIKSRAIGEIGQAVGTAIVVVAIIAIFSFVGAGIFAQVPAITPKALQTICGQLQNSQVTFLQPSGAVSNPSGAFADGVPSPTALVCNEVQNPALDPLTHSIDYGLFAGYLIIANMTNQTIANLNSMYNFEGWLGFASKFFAVTQICIGPESTPLCGSTIPVEELQFKYAPLAGYETFKSTVTQPTEVQATLTFYMFFLQLVVTMLILYIWPWLLAAGIILRASFFTRRAGGLIIGVVMAWLLIFPMLYAIEYNTFNNPNGGLQPIGGTNLPTLPLYTKSTTGTLGVYGAKEVGGYVPVSQDPQASSCQSTVSGQANYAYEEVCGYPQTTRFVTTRVGRTSITSPDCTSSPSKLCASSGFVPGAYIRGSPCPEDAPYAYESACGDPSSFVGVCSASESPSCLSYGTVTPQPININFFVFPSIADVLRFYSCMPSSLPGDEIAFASYYLVPGYGAVTGSLGGTFGLVTGVPYNPSEYSFNHFDPGFSCNPTQAINSALAIANVYGIVAVTAYLVPLLNLIIIISTTVGISGLLGGDTDIIGLSRLL